MINKINLTFRKIALILLFVGISALLIIFSGNQKLFKADVFDPISNNIKCVQDNIYPLFVEDYEGILNWTVTPSVGIFLDPTSGDEITQTSSMGYHDVNLKLNNTEELEDLTILVSAISDSLNSEGNPNASYDFVVNLAPPCVTNLSFIKPTGTVNPDPDGTFELKTIQIIKSDFTTKDYSGEDIDKLIAAGLEFELSEGVTQLSNYKFKVETDNPGEIVMSLSGNATDDDVTVTSNPLKIGKGACEDFRVSIIEGSGQSMNINSTAVGSKSITFDFEEFDASNILLQNTGEGSQFAIEFIFDKELVDNAEESYVSSGNQYTITIRDDGQNKQTADNFRYAVNEYLSDYFIAYNKIGTNAGVYLQSLERGIHTNEYECSINDYEVFENLCAPHLNIANDSTCNGIFLGDEHSAWEVYDTYSYIQYSNEVNGSTRISAMEFDGTTNLNNNELYAEWISDNGSLVFRCPNYNAHSGVVNFDLCTFYLDVNTDGDFDDITDPSDPADDIFDKQITLVPAYVAQVQSIFNFNDSFFTQELNVYGEICGNGLNDDGDSYGDATDPDCANHISNMFADSGSSINACFTGGEGDEPSDPVKFIEPTINQMDTHLIYALGGTLPIEWETLDSNIVGLSLPGEELTEDDLFGNDNVLFPRQNINSDEIVTSLNVNSDDDNCVVGVDDMYSSCEVFILANLTYTTDNSFDVVINSTSFNKEGIVNLIGDGISGLVASEPVNVYVTSPKIITITGLIDGTVNGDAIGGVQADVILTVETTLSDHGEITTDIKSLVVDLIKDETLIPTDRNPDPNAVVDSAYSVLTARRAGTAKITATDANSCFVELPIKVVPMNLYVDFANSEDAEKDSFKTGDTVELKAWTAYNRESEGENVISKVTWVIGNPEVASIDETGVLTFSKEGRASLYAMYVPGQAEIPPLTSDNFVIETNSLTGLTLSLDRSALDKLSVSVKKNAYESLLLAIHSSNLSNLIIEGQNINFNSVDFTDLVSEKEKIDAMTNHLVETGLNINGVNIVKNNGGIGLLMLTAENYPNTNSSDMDNGIVDISEVSKYMASIISLKVGALDLPISETYELIILGEYKNGITKRLNPTDVDLISSLGFLDQGLLDSGVLKFKDGEMEGTTSVIAQIETINSGSLSVAVSSGPVISKINMDNIASISKDSSLSFNVEISDINGVDDIESIEVELFKADTNGKSLGSQIDMKTPYESNNPPTSDDTGSSDDDSDDEDSLPVVNDVITHKTFDVNYTIPNTSYILDGDYILNFIVKDFDGYQTSMEYPIYIGAVATGNVFADGKVDKIDVLYIYQIAIGKREPTQTQRLAADINGDGKVTIFDALQLFKQINN